jgi:hypothetical protein
LYKSFTSAQSSNSFASCAAVSRCFAAVHCLAAQVAVKVRQESNHFRFWQNSQALRKEKVGKSLKDHRTYFT